MRIITKSIREGPSIPIIIPVAHAEDDLVARCLHNLEMTTRSPLKVYLVESSGKEYGWGRSMNAGIKAAGNTEFFIGMDSDAFPSAYALDKLIAYSLQNDRLGYVGTKNITPNQRPNLAWAIQGFWGFLWTCLLDGSPLYAIRRFGEGQWWALSPKALSRHRPGRTVGFVSTMFFLRKACYDDVGDFDEDFRTSYVDVDYAYRVLTSDWFISSCPEAEVFHELHVTRMAQKDMAEFEGLAHFTETWNKERMRAVKRSAREGKFICNGV